MIKDQLNQKSGRSAVCVDCISMKVIRRGGPKKDREELIDWSIKNGFSANQEEENISMMDTCFTLYRLLNSNRDIIITIFIAFLLLVSFYLDLQGSLLTGKVLTAFGSTSDNQRHSKNRKYRIQSKY